MQCSAVTSFLASAFMCVVLAGPANATDSIDCSSVDGGASIYLTLGSLPILAIVGADIHIGDMRWTLHAKDAETPVKGNGNEIALIVGQALRNGDAMMADFTDPNVERIVASLRLFMSAEHDMFAMAGTLTVTDHGTWAITCIGP